MQRAVIILSAVLITISLAPAQAQRTESDGSGSSITPSGGSLCDVGRLCRSEQLAGPNFRVDGLLTGCDAQRQHRSYSITYSRTSSDTLSVMETPTFLGAFLWLAANETRVRIIEEILLPAIDFRAGRVSGYHITVYDWRELDGALRLTSDTLRPVAPPDEFGWDQGTLHQNLTAGGLVPILWGRCY